MRTVRSVALATTALLALVGGIAWSRLPVVECVPPSGLLRSGDLVFLTTRTMRGLIVRWFAPAADADYSHVGFVVVQDGEPWVLHADPTAGRVVTERLADVVRGASASRADFVRLDASGSATARVVARASALAAAGVPFDDDFDLADPSRLYCTELVRDVLDAEGLAPRTPVVRDGYLWPVDVAEAVGGERLLRCE
jgi:hypothetical protein